MARQRSRCPAEVTLRAIDGRWKVKILYHLCAGVKRFSELRRAIGGVTQKVLTQQLRQMERDGIVSRTVYPEVPPRVEYQLTPRGEALRPVIEAMSRWAVEHSGYDGFVCDGTAKRPEGCPGVTSATPSPS